MKTLTGIVRLTRPMNMIICGISVFSAALLAGKPLTMAAIYFTSIGSAAFESTGMRVLAASFSAAFILATGNVFNDVRDRATDLINTPWRPLVSGEVSVTAAFWATVAFTVIGIGLSLPLGRSGIEIALLSASLLFFYDIRLKGVPFAGNFVVALLGGLTFIYGGIAGGSVHRALLPASFAFLLHLGRELIKDAVDVEGDKKTGIRTVATVFSAVTAGRLAAIVLSLLAAATLVPFALGMFGKTYMGIVALAVWPPLGYAVKATLKTPVKESLVRASLLLKIAMPMGLVAVLAGFQGM